MRHNVVIAAIAVVGIVAGSLSGSAAEWRRPVGYASKTQAAQPAVVRTVAGPVKQVKAEPTIAELRAMVADLTKRIEALEAAEARDSRDIVELKNSTIQPVSQPSRPRQVETIITNDLFPNEYPYGG